MKDSFALIAQKFVMQTLYVQLQITNVEVVVKQSNHPVFNPNSKPLPRFNTRPVSAGLHTLLFFLLMSWGSAAMAIGFGELRVQSALGQPLRAQIGLLGGDTSDADNHCFKAQVTSLDGVRLGVVSINVKNGVSTPMIELVTSQNLSEPALAVAIEYTCGSLTRREYQILLDLPAVALPVVEARPAAESLAALPQLGAAPITAGGAVEGSGTAPKKKGHHRATAELASVDDRARVKSVDASESKDIPTKKSSIKAFRNVLRLARDENVDAGLNGVEGMHLALSRSLFGSNINLDVKPGDAPAALTTGNSAPVAVSDPAVQAAEPALPELQAKIRVLEAETAELRKLNAAHLTALKEEQKSKESNNSLLYLYFLLFACIAAIGWLMWRMKRIQSEIVHSSWEEIVPESDLQAIPVKQVQPDTYVAHDDHFDHFDDVVSPSKVSSRPQPDIAPAEPPVPLPQVPLAPDAATLEGVHENHDGDHKFFANVRSSLPNAEEILDEIQQAEFWMDMQQPLRAIEILEANWGVERPSSPLPWLYLLDLYQMVNDQQKYEELAECFKRIFNGKVVRWSEAPTRSRSLEEFPLLIKKIIQLWPTDELVPFLESLLIDDRDGRRQGFDLAAYRDILFLMNIAQENQAQAAHLLKMPNLSIIK